MKLEMSFQNHFNGDGSVRETELTLRFSPRVAAHAENASLAFRQFAADNFYGADRPIVSGVEDVQVVSASIKNSDAVVKLKQVRVAFLNGQLTSEIMNKLRTMLPPVMSNTLRDKPLSTQMGDVVRAVITDDHEAAGFYKQVAGLAASYRAAEQARQNARARAERAPVQVYAGAK